MKQVGYEVNIVNQEFTRGSLTDRSATVVTGTTAVSIAANPGRKFLMIANPGVLAHQFLVGGTLESLWVSLVGTAAVNGPSSIEIPPGSSLVFENGFIPTDAISINATTSSHRFVAMEG